MPGGALACFCPLPAMTHWSSARIKHGHPCAVEAIRRQVLRFPPCPVLPSRCFPRTLRTTSKYPLSPVLCPVLELLAFAALSTSVNIYSRSQANFFQILVRESGGGQSQAPRKKLRSSLIVRGGARREVDSGRKAPRYSLSMRGDARRKSGDRTEGPSSPIIPSVLLSLSHFPRPCLAPSFLHPSSWPCLSISCYFPNPPPPAHPPMQGESGGQIMPPRRQ